MKKVAHASSRAVVGALALALALVVAGCGERHASRASSAPGVSESPRGTPDASHPSTTCGPSAIRSETRTGYPVRLPLADAVRKLALSEAFRADNPAPWQSVVVDDLGLVALSHAPGAGWLGGDPNGRASAAAAFLRRNAPFFGVAPGETLEACVDASEPPHGVSFGQHWGPHRVGDVEVSAMGTSGHFVPGLRPPPRELEGDVLLAPLVGLRGVVTTTLSYEPRPCDPGPGGRGCGGARPETPKTSRQPYVLERKDLEVSRHVMALIAEGEPTTAELRIVAVLRERLSGGSREGPGSDRQARVTTRTFTLGDGGARVGSKVDAVTGEPLDGRRVVFRGR